MSAGRGKKRIFTCDALRSHPSADRFASRAAALLGAREDTVEVTLHQEARQLREGDLVEVTDALLGYDETVMRARQVRKNLATIEATLEGLRRTQYIYTPEAFPPGASEEAS